MRNIRRQLDGYHVTTAEILYHMPDHPDILQTYIWQDLDQAPIFPVLRKFLTFWRRKLDGRLHSVRVASVPLSGWSEFRHLGLHLTLH